MDLFANLYLGFETVLKLVPVNFPIIGATVPIPINILLCFLGCLVGTLVGVLPGVGPIATIAILLPITFGLDPVGALIMLAGIYYGAQYGGSTTAILVNIPGEATSVVTVLDGTRWRARAAPASRSGWRRSARSSRAAWRRC
jgi:putative tricarboxylic transport membrane protein